MTFKLKWSPMATELLYIEPTSEYGRAGGVGGYRVGGRHDVKQWHFIADTAPSRSDAAVVCVYNSNRYIRGVTSTSFLLSFLFRRERSYC